MIAAAAGALGACGADPVGGNPTAAPGTGDSAAPTTTKSGSPSGAPDLDIAEYVANPCSVLTQAQQSELGTFREAKVEQDGVNGPSCTYQGKDVLANSTFKIVMVTKGNTVETFAREGKANFPVSRENTVLGYPTASFATPDGKRDCNTAIGTSGKDAILIQGSIAKNDTKLNDGNACGTTERVAATIIGNLKG